KDGSHKDSTARRRNLSDEPIFGGEMDLFDDDKIARLLRLKRYEQPPSGYFENFLQEFRRRRRDELLRQSRWSIWVDRVQDFVFPHNVRPLASYSVGIVLAIACAAVLS